MPPFVPPSAILSIAIKLIKLYSWQGFQTVQRSLNILLGQVFYHETEPSPHKKRFYEKSFTLYTLNYLSL